MGRRRIWDCREAVDPGSISFREPGEYVLQYYCRGWRDGSVIETPADLDLAKERVEAGMYHAPARRIVRADEAHLVRPAPRFPKERG